VPGKVSVFSSNGGAGKKTLEITGGEGQGAIRRTNRRSSEVVESFGGHLKKTGNTSMMKVWNGIATAEEREQRGS